MFCSDQDPGFDWQDSIPFRLVWLIFLFEKTQVKTVKTFVICLFHFRVKLMNHEHKATVSDPFGSSTKSVPQRNTLIKWLYKNLLHFEQDSTVFSEEKNYFF